MDSLLAGCGGQTAGRARPTIPGTLQDEVQLAAQAQSENGVQECGHERGRSGDGQCPRDACEMEDESDRDDEQPDALREARRARILEFGGRLRGAGG